MAVLVVGNSWRGGGDGGRRRGCRLFRNVKQVVFIPEFVNVTVIPAVVVMLCDCGRAGLI